MKKELNMEALQATLAMLDKSSKAANEQAKADGCYDSRMEKLNELLSSESICDKLLAAENAAEARAVLAENGLDMTEEEVNALGQYVASISKKLIENGGELAEEDLEKIAGGILTETVSVISAASSTSLFSSSIATGAAAGSSFPVVGTIIGAAVAAGVATAVIYREEIVSGLKKAGEWIKSWF